MIRTRFRSRPFRSWPLRSGAVALLLILALGLGGCGSGKGSLTRVVTRSVVALVAKALGLGAAPEGEAALAGEAREDGADTSLLDAMADAVVGVPEGEEPATRQYYSYVEPGGALRFVEDLGDVPPELRASARKIDVGGGRPLEVKSVRRRAPRRGPEQIAVARAGPPPIEVVVYTTSWCQWCRRTLAFLDAKGVDYVNKDIESNAAWREELIEKTGGTSIPVIEIDGELVKGFDRAALERLL